MRFPDIDKMTTRIRYTWKGIKDSPQFRHVLASVAAIAAGLVVCFAILLLTHPSGAFLAFWRIITGGRTGGSAGRGNALCLAAPIILTGLSVGFAKRVGQFNVGTPGQFLFGAFSALYIGAQCTFIPVSIRWAVALLGAFLAGALWGLIPGVLKAVKKTDIFITAMLMNFIAVFGVDWLIGAAFSNPTVQSGIVLPSMGLNKLFEGSCANIGIIIAVLCALIIYILFKRTVFGFEMNVVGQNYETALNIGINTKKTMIVSMFISGALSGLGGGILYLSGTGLTLAVSETLAFEGLVGIAAAAIALFNPLGILFVGLYFGCIQQGSTYIAELGYSSNIIGIITSVMFYFSAFSTVIGNIVLKSGASKKRGVK